MKRLFINIILLTCSAALAPEIVFGSERDSVSSTTSALHVFELMPSTQYLELGANVQYYEDANKSLTFANMHSPEIAAQWQIYSKQTLSFGYKRSAYWLRFALRNAAPQNNDWLLEVAFPTLDSIELYSPQVGGKYTRHVMGDYVPFSKREVKYRTYVKHLDLPDSQAHIYYVRISTTSTTVIPITLHRNDEFIEYTNRLELFYGLLLGALVILTFYRLILFMIMRESIYVFYIVYMFGILLWTATFNGFTAQYILPERVKLVQYSMMLSIGLSLFGSVLFTRAFLNTAKESPRLDVVLRSLAIYLFVLTASVFFIDYLTVNFLLTSSLLPVVAICFGTALSNIRRVRSRQYQYFLVGCFSLLFGGSIVSFMAMGILPNNMITRNSIQVGAIIESILFSLALSQRYKILQLDKEYAQAENVRLIRDANETLRRAVQERTAELNEKNADLETANEEIQRQVDIQSEQSREIELANTLLLEQNETLNVLNKEKNEIMGIVAHDLKNPISAVRGLADLVQSGFVESKHVPEITAQIVNTADRMLDLVKNLLDVNRLESGAVEFKIMPFDIAPVLESTVWQYRQLAEAKHIALHYSAEATSSMVTADEQAVMQVLDNIASNAVKYTPPGKQVFVRLLSNDSAVRIEVQDEGPGLSKEDMAKLFGKFARLSAQPTGGEHSTGLGLSIVKKMVEAMQGRVWCESEFGNGATFIVELPHHLATQDLP